jgi:hypothetical protein
MHASRIDRVDGKIPAGAPVETFTTVEEPSNAGTSDIGSSASANRTVTAGPNRAKLARLR